MHRFLTVLATVFVVSAPAGAQQYQRRATMVGGGSGDRGKCTIEVVVDGAAEVEIRGDQGSIRNLSGNPAEWRRFQCNAPLPRDPADFRFEGVDGRGRQQLVRDPRNGGAAVVRIEDSQGGSEGYTFDLVWGGVNVPGGFNSAPAPGPGPGNRGPDGYGPAPGPDNRYQDRDRDHRGGSDRPSNRFTTEQAVRTCEEAVRHQALDRFRGRRVEFINTRIDNNPGRNDWVVGMIDVVRDRDRSEGRYQFSCSVNFDTGQIRSVQIERTRYRN